MEAMTTSERKAFIRHWLSEYGIKDIDDWRASYWKAWPGWKLWQLELGNRR